MADTDPKPGADPKSSADATPGADPAPADAAELRRRLESTTERLLSVFEELDFLHSLAETLASPEGVDDLPGYLLDETLKIFSADGGWILRPDADGELQVVAQRHLPEPVVTYLSQKVVPELLAQDALPFLVDDLHRALIRLRPRIGHTPESIRPRDLPRAFLAARLNFHQETLGVIALVKKAPGNAFSSGDQRLLTTLASQAGLFLQNGALMRQLQDEAIHLGRRLEQLEGDTGPQMDIAVIRGPSEAMNRLAGEVEGAAGTDSTVLLLGESGTGKSLVARILHGESGRRDGPMVEINCGAVPPALIESELFGHARGAFTGADRDRPGLFEEAEGGSIFLDEIAELPMESQVKLLTVLEGRRIRRVGENRDRLVNARVIAATNADLARAVGEGAFREDLFYRLNVISLTVPPLRQRGEDILPLARKFLEELAMETHRRVTGFSPDAQRALVAYPWPGNVRELRNVVERSLLLKREGDRIELGDLSIQPPVGATSSGYVPASPVNAPVLPEPGESLSDAVEDYEETMILAALEETGGVVSRAAKRLGISRTNLHNKMRKHGLERKSTFHDNSND